MKKGIAWKILYATLFVGVLSLSVVVPLVYWFGDQYTNITISAGNNTAQIANQELSKAFINVGQIALREVAVDVARSAAEYMRAHPETMNELAYDKVFSDITVRNMFGRGYTAVFDPISYFNVTHPSVKSSARRLEDTEGFDFTAYASLMQLLDRAVYTDGVSGIYKFTTPEGVLADKFMYIAWIPERTKDGVRLVVTATAFQEDFVKQTSRLSSLLEQKFAEASSDAGAKGQWVVFAISLGIALVSIIVMYLAITFSKKISEPIIRLVVACERIASGRFDAAVVPVPGTDEISQLSVSIERMRKSLREQSDHIIEQAAEARDRAHELEEALELAEERTRQLIVMQQKTGNGALKKGDVTASTQSDNKSA